MRERLNLVDKNATISQRKQYKLLGVNRSSLYIKPKGESDENKLILQKIDKIHLKEPSFGVERMQDALLEQGHQGIYRQIHVRDNIVM